MNTEINLFKKNPLTLIKKYGRKKSGADLRNFLPPSFLSTNKNHLWISRMRSRVRILSSNLVFIFLRLSYKKHMWSLDQIWFFYPNHFGEPLSPFSHSLVIPLSSHYVNTALISWLEISLHSKHQTTHPGTDDSIHNCTERKKLKTFTHSIKARKRSPEWKNE